MIRKRCQKCGKTARVRPRETRCKQPTGAFGSFACWGRLERVVSEKPREANDRLAKKLVQAHEDFAAAITRLKRATTQVSKYQRRIKSIERSIELRDHPELKSKPREKPRTRAIALPDDDAPEPKVYREI